MRKLLEFSLVFGMLAVASSCRRSASPVVATVGSAQITAAEVQSRLEEAPPEFQQYAASPAGRRQFLNLLIREKIVLREAQRAGVQKEPTYQQAVERYNAQLQQRLQEYKDTLLVNSFLRKLGSHDLAATDNEVSHFYEEHRADFERPMEIQASHILVSSPQAAAEVLERLRQGVPFEKVAHDLSQDPTTAARGGKLAPFVKGMGNGLKEIEEQAALLPVGQISNPIQTPFGFHIIKKTAERRLPPRSYDESKETIRTRLEKQKFEQWVSAKQAMLGVHVNDAALAAIAITSAPPQEPARHENE